MQDILYKYLILNQRLQLPSIGSFSIDTLPAEIDKANGLLHAPTQVIRYRQGEAAADRHFISFVAKETGLDEEDAVREFNDYITRLQHESGTNHGVEISGMGTLKKETNGHYLFLSDRSVNEMYPQLKLSGNFEVQHAYYRLDKPTAHRKIENEEEAIKELEVNEEELIESKEEADYWWVYVMIILLLGLGALLFYYV